MAVIFLQMLAMFHFQYKITTILFLQHHIWLQIPHFKSLCLLHNGVMEWHYNLAFIKKKDKLVPLCNLKKYHYLYLHLKWYIYSLCNSKNMPSRGLSRIHEVMFT